MDGYRLATGKAVDDVIDDIASDIDRAVNRRLLTSYTDNMTRAVQGVFPDTGYGSRYHDIAHRLEANAARFAAYKAYHATEQVKRQLTSPGTPDECRQRARGALRAFNRYQAAEYNTAVARCRTARQWIGFDDATHRELFPHLRWLPSRSATPREQHMPYYNRVWAKDDPFWTQNQPGNLWNCKCDWEETADDIDHDGVTVTPPPPSLAGNPAITGEIFTDKAIYFSANGNEHVCRGILEAGEVGFFRKGKIGEVDILSHILHEPGEISGNMEVLSLFCKHNAGIKQVKLLPNVIKDDAHLRPQFYPGGKLPRGANKNADAVIEWANGEKWVVDFKCMQGDGGKLKDRLISAYEQADYSIIKIKGYIKDERAIIETAERFMKTHNKFKGILIYNSIDKVLFQFVK